MGSWSQSHLWSGERWGTTWIVTRVSQGQLKMLTIISAWKSGFIHVEETKKKMSRELSVIRADAGVHVLSTQTCDLCSGINASCTAPACFTSLTSALQRFLCRSEHVRMENLLLPCSCVKDKLRSKSGPKAAGFLRSSRVKTLHKDKQPFKLTLVLTWGGHANSTQMGCCQNGRRKKKQKEQIQ